MLLTGGVETMAHSPPSPACAAVGPSIDKWDIRSALRVRVVETFHAVAEAGYRRACDPTLVEFEMVGHSDEL